jgi:hypothetical protein
MELVVAEQNMTYQMANKLLGTGSCTEIEHVVKCYLAKTWAAMENNELTPQLESDLASSWRFFNQNDVSRQIAENGKFELNIQLADPELKVETCDACKGAGERFKFAKKPVQVGCLKCKDSIIRLNGKDLIIELDTIMYDGKDVSDEPRYQKYLGKVVEDCISCNGTGRYVYEDPEFGGKNDLKCKTCHGINIDGKSKTTQIITKCKTCKGKRQIKIPVISPIIKSTTICRKCSGKGFVNTKPEKVPMNPVMTVALADKIKGL